MHFGRKIGEARDEKRIKQYASDTSTDLYINICSPLARVDAILFPIFIRQHVACMNARIDIIEHGHCRRVDQVIRIHLPQLWNLTLNLD